MPDKPPPRDRVEAQAVTVVAHPPERRRLRSMAPAQPGPCSCCCCCCCCLHTVGGLIGAAVASGKEEVPAPAYSREVGRASPEPPSWSAATCFWWTVLALVVVAFIVLTTQKQFGRSPMVGGILILLALPALQLAAVIVTALVLALSNRPDKSSQFRLLGRILAGLAVGTLIGGVVTVAAFVLFLGGLKL